MVHEASQRVSLNESPSEKEGKFPATRSWCSALRMGLNESPSEKEGKLCHDGLNPTFRKGASMKALPKRKGNLSKATGGSTRPSASMKALPKRKGNVKLNVL